MAEPGRGPFFALLHTYQVHAPYLPPADIYPRFVDRSYVGPLRERLERYLTLPPEEQWEGGVGPDYWEGMTEYTDADVRFLSDLYDAEIAYVDECLRPLLEQVLVGDRSGDTALILLADHGEEFRDHGKFQHDQVFEELLRVPLIIRLPGWMEGQGWTGRVEDPVELVDVAPTIAALLGVDVSGAGWEGRSLIPLMDPAQSATGVWRSRPSFSELVVDPGPKFYRTITYEGWKYIHAWQKNIDSEWEWLFDLTKDPTEQVNLADSKDAEHQGMKDHLVGLLDAQTRSLAEKAIRLGTGEESPLDDDMRVMLEQLGYIGSDSDG
jgi:arylsulfatase A-like enzyme